MYKKSFRHLQRQPHFLLLVSLYIYKYKSLNCSYTDMSAKKRPGEGLWPETRSVGDLRADCHFIIKLKRNLHS